MSAKNLQLQLHSLVGKKKWRLFFFRYNKNKLTNYLHNMSFFPVQSVHNFNEPKSWKPMPSHFFIPCLCSRRKNGSKKANSSCMTIFSTQSTLQLPFWVTGRNWKQSHSGFNFLHNNNYYQSESML